jgi:hypothetical protein
MANDSLGQMKKKSFDKRGNEGKGSGIKDLPKFLKFLGDFQRGMNIGNRRNSPLVQPGGARKPRPGIRCGRLFRSAIN